ncbi:MAG: tRNA (adenosine(37)-N6)-dimethylallyltransferase MiaA [bacterium]
MPIDIPLVVICGPTASGKSEAGLILAQKLKSEIISADSRQIYKYMDIGTAKPGEHERNLVRHHFIDIIEPDQSYNAGQFQKDSLPIIESLRKHQKIPLMVGGTGLYIRAAVYGLFSGPPSNASIKATLKKIIAEKGVYSLFQELKTIDPKTAAHIHHNDKQRIMRALEVYYTTGETISSLHTQHNPYKPLRPTLIFLLHPPREQLYRRIEQRVDSMMKQGFLDEVKHLLRKGYTKDDPGMQSLGYRILTQHCEDKTSLTIAVSLIKRDTRHYAKRQMTWFRQERKAQIIHMTESTSPSQIADIIEKIINQNVNNNQCKS